MGAVNPGSGPLLITGAGGLVGRRCRELVHRMGIASEACSRRPEPGADVVDATDHAAFAAFVRRIRPQAILHLAAVGVHPARADDPGVFEANLAMANAVVRAAALVPGCRVVCAGSMAEYGDHAGPLHEDLPMVPAANTTAYATAKLAAGLHARSLGLRLGVPVIVARLFGVYGPGESPHRLFPTLIAGLRAGTPVPLSDGRQRRDFIHVDDACRVLVDLAGSTQGGVVNVGTGVAVAVGEVCRRLAATMGADPGLLQFGVRARSPGDADLLVADTTRLAAIVGGVPEARLARERYDLGWFG